MEGLRQVLAVGLVLLSLAGSLWWLRRKRLVAFPGSGPRGAALEKLGRLALGPQHSLVLVRVGETVLVLALHAGGCTLVERLARRELDRREGEAA